MKSINVTFEDREFEDLKKLKGDKPWHDFILDKAKVCKEPRGFP